MPFRQGRYSEITISGVAFSTYLDTIELTNDTEQLETTTFTATSKTYLTGLQDNKLSIGGNYDPTTNNGPIVVLQSFRGQSNAVPVQFFPGGNSAGQRKEYFDAYLVSYNETSDVGGLVKFTADFAVNGPVTASGI